MEFVVKIIYLTPWLGIFVFYLLRNKDLLFLYVSSSVHLFNFYLPDVTIKNDTFS